MAQTTTTGKTFAIASTYGTVSNITAATNATECVVSLGAGHGVVVGEYLHLSGGWPLADNRVFRAKTVATNDVTIEGFNTLSTSRFPAGAGLGTIRRVTAWAVISQVRVPGVDGGSQDYTDGSYLENPINIDVPASKQAIKMNLELAHDISLAYRSVVQAAQDAGLPVGFRQINALGRPSVGAAFWSIQNMATGNRNEIEVSALQCSFANDVTHYAS